MERLILREHIKEVIGNRKVVAALFHTFNFDPRFFENFVMPLFLPGKKFTDEIIHNKILWRYCAKENLIPPIAVYCDYYAKDNTEAPSLGYDIYTIKMPSARNVISNFHPKHIFILLEDEYNIQSLILIVGSGNLTANGWCENFESFSIREIKKTKNHPYTVRTNNIQQYITDVNQLAALKSLLPADKAIHDFLFYTDLNIDFFNSFSQSFKDFVIQHIIKDDNINEVEIISPFFSNDIQLIQELYWMGVSKVNCLIPTLRNNEVQMDKQLFIEYEKAGLEWCLWANKETSKEVRNQHAKIYRFYSDTRCYTIIGSVNFTKPAWAKFEAENNNANIETAVLYTEKLPDDKLLKRPVNFDINSFNFIEKEDIENPFMETLFSRNAPNIEFTINWKKHVLKVQAAFSKISCYLYDILDDQKIKKGNHSIHLSPVQLRSLAKNLLIKVKVVENNKSTIYHYYAHQINIETKPLNLTLDANFILKYWFFLKDEFEKGKLTRNLAEQSTDESGIVHEEKIEVDSLLNQMAAHFNGLIKLEKHLFNDQKDINTRFQDIKYYLLSEGIDTLPFYLSDLNNQYEKANIQKSFYWMVLQILINNFYNKGIKFRDGVKTKTEDWRKLRADLKLKKTELTDVAAKIVVEIEGLKQKENWFIEELIKEYD